MLTLPIKKKWYDMIASGEKKEEYRAFTKYYGDRLGAHGGGDGSEHFILLRNGYGKCRPTLMCKTTITLGQGREEWGAERSVEYFILKILNVTDVTTTKGGE